MHAQVAMLLQQLVMQNAHPGHMFRTSALPYALVMADAKTADTYATSQMQIHFVRFTAETPATLNGRQARRNSWTHSLGQAGECLT